MRHIMHSVSLIPIFLLFVGSAHAQSSTDRQLRDSIQLQYDKICVAYKQEDVSAVLAFYTPDSIFKPINGKASSYDQMEAGLRNQFAQLKTLDLRVRVKSARRVGESVVCDATAEQKVVQKIGSIPSKTAPIPSVVLITMRDTWVRNGNRWQISKSEEAAQPKLLTQTPAKTPAKK